MFAAFGCTYCFSTFFTPLQDAFDASRAALSWIFSIAVFIYFLLGAVSGPLADRVGPRGMTLAGLVIIGAGLIVASQAEALWQVYLGHGVGVGIGVGFAYVPAIGAVQRWFVRRRGFASGIAVSGIGAGTLVMPLIAGELIARMDWRSAWVVLGVLMIMIGGAAALLVDNSPERHGALPDGGIVGVGENAGAKSIQGASVRRAVTSRPFVMLYLSLVVIWIGASIPFVHLVPYAEDRGLS